MRPEIPIMNSAAPDQTFRKVVGNIAAFSAREGGRLRAGEPNAAGDEAEGREAVEAELSCKPTNLFAGS